MTSQIRVGTAASGGPHPVVGSRSRQRGTCVRERRRSRPAEAACAPDQGFTLLEVVVALLLLAIVATASLGLFLRSLTAGDLQSQRLQAIELANNQIEFVRSLPTGSLVQGRTRAEVDALWAGASALFVDTSTSVEIWDPSAGGGTADLVPISRTQVLNGQTYTVTTFVDRCYQVLAGSACGTDSSGTRSTPMTRVTVSVTWTAGPTVKCGTSSGLCVYQAATLIDASSDPTFNSN